MGADDTVQKGVMVALGSALLFGMSASLAGMVTINDGINNAVPTGYTIPGAVAQPGGAGRLPLAPVTRWWWNPDESGTGCNVQVHHGTLVVTMYGYAPMGDPIRYRAAGGLAHPGNNVVATGTLDKYRGGQWASCMCQRPAMTGNDGGITITFKSSSAATVLLPRGRVTLTKPMAWQFASSERIW
jgi:hypothetical protein